MASNQATPQRIDRIEVMLRQFDEHADANVRELAREIVAALLDFYGAGLARIVAVAEREGAAQLLTALAQDDIVANLLLLHDLHPEPLEARIAKALESVRPYLKSHGGNVELLGIDDGVVRLRMEGSCHGCPSSALTMKSTIEGAVYAAAPEVARIELDQPPETAPSRPAAGFVPLATLRSAVQSTAEKAEPCC